jgi:glycosyltransferase involved in cell wall biosynthesis
VRLARRRRPAAPTAFAPVVRHARRWKADAVVLSQGSCWGAYSEMLALAEAGIPYLGISQLNTPFSWPNDGLFEALGEAFAGAEAAVFVSRGNLVLFENQVARKLENSHVIYNPPSFDVSTPCGPPPAEGFRLLNVARIDANHKGQDLLCDVLAMPKWRERRVELEIAGAGNRRWLESLLASKGLTNVKLLGHVDDLRGAWERATFGILSSRYEGMPLALIEGMALGRAVVATDVAGHGEWIEHGRNGFLAAGCSPAALDAALEEAWASRGGAGELGSDARRRSAEMLADAPADRLADLVRETFAE